MTDIANAQADTAPEQELAGVEEFVIRINREEVWRSQGKAMLVNKVTVSTSHGEVSVIGSANTDKYIDITVNERDAEMSSTDLDIIEEEKAQARRDRLEPEPDKTREGYVEADPETGLPIESTRVPMADDEVPEPEEEDDTQAPTEESEPTPNDDQPVEAIPEF